MFWEVLSSVSLGADASLGSFSRSCSRSLSPAPRRTRSISRRSAPQRPLPVASQQQQQPRLRGPSSFVPPMARAGAQRSGAHDEQSFPPSSRPTPWRRFSRPTRRSSAPAWPAFSRSATRQRSAGRTRRSRSRESGSRTLHQRPKCRRLEAVSLLLSTWESSHR